MGDWTWSTFSKISDINDILAKVMHFGRGTVPGRVTVAILTTRREREQKLRRDDNDDDRKAALHELWQRRRQLRAERKRNTNMYVLEHL